MVPSSSATGDADRPERPVGDVRTDGDQRWTDPAVGHGTRAHGPQGSVPLARALVGAVVVLGAFSGSAPFRAGHSPGATGGPGVGARASGRVASTGAGRARTVDAVRVRIPAVGIDSGLMGLGLRSDGSLQVPPTGFPAGWYTGGPTPGELGPAVILGHVDWDGPAVFQDLHAVRRGQLITVTRADGSTPTFRVTAVGRFPKDRFPTARVYGNLDHAALRVITCGGAVGCPHGPLRGQRGRLRRPRPAACLTARA